MPPPDPPTTTADADLDLVRRAQAGEYEAFEAIVSRYETRIYNLALRVVAQVQDAEEVVQQTCLSVIEHLTEFRGESLFSTWLMRIAMNHALVLLRRRAQRRTVPLVDDRVRDDEPPPQPDFVAQWRETPEQIASRHETRELVDRALAELDEKYRLVFVLRDIEGLSTAETASALGISEANTKVRLLRARLMLRERLTRVFGGEQ